MGVNVGGSSSSSVTQSEEQMELRRGPWTVEEDLTLINYIANNGEGRWNSLALCAGLKRTGKSCRLRWLNYLRPDIRRGNITLEEQLLILELHSRWGNRWSKIAQQLPGRTDNEIKNYWRTRVQKHAKQLQCDVKSKQFKDAMRHQWMPRLAEKIRAAAAAATSGRNTTTTTHHLNNNNKQVLTVDQVLPAGSAIEFGGLEPASSDCIGTQITPVSVSDYTDYYNLQYCYNNVENTQNAQVNIPEYLTSPSGFFNHGLEFQGVEQNNMWFGGEDVSENLWNVDGLWLLQQRLCNGV